MMSSSTNKKKSKLYESCDAKKEKSSFQYRMKKLLSDMKSKKETLAGVQTGFPSSLASFVENAQLRDLFSSRKKQKKGWFCRRSSRKENGLEDPGFDPDTVDDDVSEISSRKSLDSGKYGSLQHSVKDFRNSGRSVQQSENDSQSNIRSVSKSASDSLPQSVDQIISNPQPEKGFCSNPDEIITNAEPEKGLNGNSQKRLPDHLSIDCCCSCHEHMCSSKLQPLYRYTVTVLLLMITFLSVFVDAKKAALGITILVFIVLRLVVFHQDPEKSSRKHILKKASIQRSSSFPPKPDDCSETLNTELQEAVLKSRSSKNLPNSAAAEDNTNTSSSGCVAGSSLLVIILAGLTVGPFTAFLMATCWCILMKSISFLG